ncbi:S4 domain-containing protein YaaA [Philodulcilactobacillus myokoensis]|uniref:S4 domain-containing protein YaaA n=1 Tax=Philodulcilactobacillus myokoensis TaxID=2929573 RepID=UPI002570ECF1|nr:S4 domain-containing protein YaaA [Philodulcilactobacillus myokoensis]
MKKAIPIHTPYVTLGQLLKMVSAIGTGGEAKWYLKQRNVSVNSEIERRRGRKLYPGDNIEVPDMGLFFIRSDKVY